MFQGVCKIYCPFCKYDTSTDKVLPEKTVSLPKLIEKPTNKFERRRKLRFKQIISAMKSGDIKEIKRLLIIVRRYKPEGKIRSVKKLNMSPDVYGGMSKLAGYVLKHTMRTDSEGVDVQFFHVSQVGEPTEEELKTLIQRHVGDFCEVDLFDDREHGYIELGVWCGTQELALQLMGLGTILGLFELMTPNNMLPDAYDELKNELAGKGFIIIKAKT
jgi:hypothetical protein